MYKKLFSKMKMCRNSKKNPGDKEKSVRLDKNSGDQEILIKPGRLMSYSEWLKGL